MNGLISIIVPCYNESAGLDNAINTIYDVMKRTTIPFEIILVDDGSKDNTFEIISGACKRDSQRLKGISFSRNFGKEAAILAGLEYAHGECAAIIDSDLQHPPEEIPKMYALWRKGYDIIEGVKEVRQKENFVSKIFAKAFYVLFSKAIGIDMENASDFKLIDRKVVDVLLSLPEQHTFFRGLTYWTGFRMTKYTYNVMPRKVGQSKWSFFSLVRYAISNIVSFSSAPLGIISILSYFMLFLAVVFGVRAIELYLTNQAAGGITTVVVLLLLVGGLILLSLSIIGRYISNIYDEVKGRPRYLLNMKTDINMVSHKMNEKSSEEERNRAI